MISGSLKSLKRSSMRLMSVSMKLSRSSLYTRANLICLKSFLRESKRWMCQKSQKLPMLPERRTHFKMRWHLLQIHKRLEPKQRRKRLMQKKEQQQRKEAHLRKKVMCRRHPKMERRFRHRLACLQSRPFLYQATHHRPG